VTLPGLVAFVALGLAFVADAAARELRHPARGTPAFAVEVPDDWTDEVDPDRNLIVTSADETTSFVFTWGVFSGQLEDAAKLMLRVANATSPTGKTPAAISGLPGFSFDSTIMITGNPLLRLKMMIVRLGTKSFGSCTKLERETNSPEQRQRADKVMRSVKIVQAAGTTGSRP
jgi:hypothetical protein